MKELNAKNLKESLWSTMNGLRDGDMQPAQGDAIASQAREILRTVNTQVKIIDKCKESMTSELRDFAMPRDTN